MPNYFQIPSCTAKLWPGHDSGTHTQTHTHTDRVNSICPSAVSWRGHKKGLLESFACSLLSTMLKYNISAKLARAIEFYKCSSYD